MPFKAPTPARVLEPRRPDVKREPHPTAARRSNPAVRRQAAPG